ncbi:hypothetical protein KCM76_10310 [Zooshikella marina]|uniref:hypothetical protein n=2 Tax=Zooshikella TaxID=202771 RepID=UPI001BAE9DD2|nr:hypothetical protein [Zooshikella ganghwensis]MBU2706382.1 hypothetical protein [Zooshikella ganghwensis]
MENLKKISQMHLDKMTVSGLIRFRQFCELLEESNGELNELRGTLSKNDLDCIIKVGKKHNLIRYMPSQMYDARYRRVKLTAKGKKLFKLVT